MNANDNYVRPDSASNDEPDDDDEDNDYRDRDRYGMRRDPYSRDEEHLRILSIIYYIFGGLGVVGGLLPLLYVVLGVVFLAGGISTPNGDGPPPEIGWLFIAIGGGLSSLIISSAVCTLFAGYNLSRNKRYLFCFVIACICCASIPLGTILGVFTIVVLARPSVKQLFDSKREAHA